MKKKKNKFNIKLAIISALAVIATAVIGSSVTKANTSWYESVKPSITPPNYIFPVVWTILYIMIAFSLYFALKNSKGKIRNKIIILFSINLVANALWSILFFGLHLSFIALIDLIVIWLTTLLMIIAAFKINKSSSYLLVPYFLWISFAGALNYLIAF